MLRGACIAFGLLLFFQALAANAQIGPPKGSGGGGSPGGAVGNPQYQASSTTFGGTPTVINALAMSGSDACAQISAAATALYNATHASSNTGGIIDARGFTGTQTCAGTMFANWPSGMQSVVLLGPVTLIQNYPWIDPAGTFVHGIEPSPAVGQGTILKVGNSFLTGIPSVAPSLSCAAGTSSYIEVTFGNSVAESLASPEKTCNATTNIQVTSPSCPTGATIYYVYAATSSGAETRQGSQNCGSTYTLSSIVAGTYAPPIAMPVVQLGGRTTTSGTGAEVYGAKVEGVEIDCTMPNGNKAPTTTSLENLSGIENETAQQQSWFSHIYTWDCWGAPTIGAGPRGVYGGSFAVLTSNAQNSGPYYDLIAGDSADLGAASVCLNIGAPGESGVVPSQAPYGFRLSKISCGGSGAGVQTVSIYLDGTEIDLGDIDCENAATCIDVAKYHGVHAGIIRGVNIDNNFTNGILLESGGPDNLVIQGIANAAFGTTPALISYPGGTSVTGRSFIGMYILNNTGTATAY